MVKIYAQMICITTVLKLIYEVDYPPKIAGCQTEKDSKAHWHRENPNRSGANKYKKYLDPDGKPVKEDKSGAHIYPNPKMVPVIIA